MTIHPFHARNDHHRSWSTWQSLIDAATSEHDVVQIARDFIASFTPHEIELMPKECRPAKIVDGQDIASFSYDMATHRCDESHASAPIVQAFVSFFSDAAQRLAYITRTNPGDRETA